MIDFITVQFVCCRHLPGGAAGRCVSTSDATSGGPRHGGQSGVGSGRHARPTPVQRLHPHQRGGTATKNYNNLLSAGCHRLKSSASLYVLQTEPEEETAEAASEDPEEPDDKDRTDLSILETSGRLPCKLCRVPIAGKKLPGVRIFCSGFLGCRKKSWETRPQNCSAAVARIH